jgi:hypothetical protein
MKNKIVVGAVGSNSLVFSFDENGAKKAKSRSSGGGSDNSKVGS